MITRWHDDESRSNDDEDEISFVLHEFRQSCSQSTLGAFSASSSVVGTLSTSSSSNIIRNSSSSSSSSKNNKSHRGCFSDVRYYRKTRSIAVSYLFDKVLIFDFEISLLLFDVDVDVDVDVGVGVGADDKSKSKSKCNRYRKYYTVTYKADKHYDCYSSSSTKNCTISNNTISNINMKEKISILKQRVQMICDDMNHRLEVEEEKNQTKNKNKDTNNNNINQLRSSTTTSSSLFAVMSKLLLSLNNLQTELLFFQHNNKNKNKNNNNEKDSTLMVLPMTDRERSSHIAHLSAKKIMTAATTATTVITKSEKNNNNKNIDFQTDITVDLALLLLRCACVGKHRDVFLNPIPPIITKKEFVGKTFDGGVADKIWIATEYRRRYRLKKQQQQQQQQQQRQQRNSLTSTTTKTGTRSSSSSSSSMVLLHPIEQELFGFLYSLPWIKRGKITAALMNPNTTAAAATPAAKANPEMTMLMDSDKKMISIKNTKSTIIHSEGNRIVIEVCLDLDSNNTYMTTKKIEDINNRNQQDENENDENDDNGGETRNDSYYSPRFARLCIKYGVCTAYHGTHMDHVWSILNNGFFNMSDHPLFCKNGAMMGSGVYLSTSKKVATFFATTNSSKNTNKIRTALKHDSLRNILQMESSLCYFDDDDGNNDEENRNRYRDLDEYYDISCYPVFENRIIRPPNDNNGEDKTDVTGSKNNSNSNISTTRRDGKYYVVPDGRDIRITRLHLTFELTRKRSNFLQKLFSSFLLPNKSRSKITYYAFFVVIISVFIRYVMSGI